jgi:hypothetical protein
VLPPPLPPLAAGLVLEEEQPMSKRQAASGRAIASIP